MNYEESMTDEELFELLRLALSWHQTREELLAEEEK